MLKNITNISGISSKLGTLARVARSKAVLTAAVAATSLGLASSSFAVDITSITTTNVAGSPSATNGVSGWPESNAYTFTSSPPINYNISYAGSDTKIVSVNTGATTYSVSPTAGTVKFETYPSLPAVTSLWYDGGGSPGTNPTIPIQGPQETTYNAAFSGNNTLVGADNVFSSAVDNINGANDQGDVARIDVLFTGGISASAANAFAVLERGAAGSHDVFKIAAITSLSGGLPASYGPLEPFTEGSWGNTNLLAGNTQEDVLRGTGGGTLHPATALVQNVGGTLIPANTLGVATGSTIYGYSLFSGAVTSANNLVSYATLPQADDEVNGGLDPVATLSNLYTTTAVPEPTSAALLTIGVGGLLARRPKRKLV